MGRPQKISDSELLAACEVVIGRYGPSFTLAQVAKEAGVAVGTVAGRFGSKHGLLLALMSQGASHLEKRMIEAAEGEPDKVAAVRAAALVTAEGINEEETTVNHLAQLGADLADPELRGVFAVQRETIRRVLSQALAAADLPFAPPADQAGAILAALVHGLQLDWALCPRHDLFDQLRADVDAVLKAWQGPA